MWGFQQRGRNRWIWEKEGGSSRRGRRYFRNRGTIVDVGTTQRWIRAINGRGSILIIGFCGTCSRKIIRVVIIIVIVVVVDVVVVVGITDVIITVGDIAVAITATLLMIAQQTSCC